MDELDAVAVHIGIAAPDSDMSMIQPLPLEDIQHLLAQSPDKNVAMEYRRQHGLALSPTEDRPLCKTNTKDFGEYSIGLELYMLFIKQMCWTFFFISVVCILPVYTNYKGNHFEVADALDLNAAFSIANGGSEYDYYVAWTSDVFYTLIFLCLLPTFLVYALARARRNRKACVQFSDYAIQVKGLPPTVTQVEVEKHFSSIGEIHQVALARKYNNLLFEYKELARLRHESDRIKTELKAKTGQDTSRKTKKLGKKIHKLQQKLAKNKKAQRAFHELPVIRAYVVFKNRQDKVNCLKYFKRRTGCAGMCSDDRLGLLYLDHYRIKVAQSPEPSGIHFENLEVTKSSRRARGFVSTLIILAFMAISVYLVYEVKTEDNEVPVCEEGEDFYNDEFEDFKDSAATKDDRYCWCKDKDTEDLAVEGDLRDFCEDYITRRTRSTLLKFGSAFGIVIVNLFLKFIIRKLIAWERHANISREKRKVMTRMFWAIFINTGFIVLLVNARFEDDLFSGAYLFEGKYKDFTKEWFLKVGGLISIMAVLAALSPHGVLLLIRYPLGACKRRCCWKRYKNQYDLNRAFLGRPFDFAGRSAQILMMISVFFLYSGGLPALNMIIFVGLAFVYWAEKVLLLRDYSTPPYFSMKMYMSSLRLLYMVIILHCAFSQYMIGSPYIFDPQDEETESDQSVRYRATNTSGYAYNGLIVLVLVMYIFAWMITKMCVWCLNKMHVRNIQENDLPLDEVIDELRVRGLITYDIYDLEHYRRLIDEMNTTAAANKSGKFNPQSKNDQKQLRQATDQSHQNSIPRHERLDHRRSRQDLEEELQPQIPRIREDDLSASSSDFEKAQSILSHSHEDSSSSSDSSD